MLIEKKSINSTHLYIIAWAFGLIFYFLDYVVRSAPAVMIPQLDSQFNISTLQLVSVIGTYYYTYSICSLVAGIALDKFGAKKSLFAGAVILGIGCLLFVASNKFSGDMARLLQGAGCAFAFPGCVYLASKGFSAKSLATAIGFTQCLGMLGGSAGQFVVGPWIAGGVSLHTFWIGIGIVTLGVAVALYLIIPQNPIKNASEQPKKSNFLSPYKIVFTNLQSWKCGGISGLLFAPTTIFAMTWGVAFFQTDRSMDFHTATIVCAMTPLGWVFGCPILGYLTDKIGKRKPVLIGGAFLMIIGFLQLIYLPNLIPPYVSTFIIGFASGVAMIPYSIIKESNPDYVKGSATGAINFLTFGVTSLISPFFSSFFGKSLTTTNNHIQHFQNAGLFWVGAIAVAIIISLFLEETGHSKSAVAV